MTTTAPIAERMTKQMKHVWENAKTASAIMAGAVVMATVVYYALEFALYVSL